MVLLLWSHAACVSYLRTSSISTSRGKHGKAPTQRVYINVKAAAHQARAGHLFGPLLTRSRNLGFLCGPFPVEDMGNAPCHKFFLQCLYFFTFLCILDVAYLNCHPLLPIINHIYLFSIPLFYPPWGTPEGRGNVAILIYPTMGTPRRQG